jgi:hypothetical protein
MPTDIHLDLLDSIQVASPCTASWDDMTGDERTRLCAQCNLHVHNLSAMTRAQAESLLAGARAGGTRLCARFYRRADGTVLTQDCPIGLARVRAATRRMIGRAAAALAMLIGAAAAAATTSRDTWGGSLRLRAVQPFATLSTWLMPAAPLLGPMAPRGRMLMGDVCIAPVPPPPAPSFTSTTAPSTP